MAAAKKTAAKKATAKKATAKRAGAKKSATKKASAKKATAKKAGAKKAAAKKAGAKKASAKKATATSGGQTPRSQVILDILKRSRRPLPYADIAARLEQRGRGDTPNRLSASVSGLKRRGAIVQHDDGTYELS